MDPTAAPIDLTIAGVLYSAHPLRDVDHQAMNKWIRGEFLRRIREATDDPAMLRAAATEAVNLVWITGPGQRLALTPEGIAKLARLMCRTNLITAAQCSNVETLDRIMDTFKQLHTIQSTKVDDEAAEIEAAGESVDVGN